MSIADVIGRRDITKVMNSAFGSRVKRRREELGMSQKDLADKAGIAQPTISFIESGRNKASTYVVQLASALKVSAQWLDTGRGPKEPSNVENGPNMRARVPLISWTTAGKWGDVQDPFSPGEAEEWIATTGTVGPEAFALRVVGDSMEPKIPDGSIVIIDPAARYEHGKIVLAKRTQDQQATLKQLWYDGAVPKLRPLNPRYPILEMPEDTRIIGVAVRLELAL
jgi:SOS-response transcriptional repressor LexA